MRPLVLLAVLALFCIPFLSSAQQAVNYQCDPIVARTCREPAGQSIPWSAYIPSDNPELRKVCNIPPSSIPGGTTNLLNTAYQLFPEGGGVDPALIRPDIYVHFTQDNSNLSFTFLTSVSSAINTMGYVRYNRITQQLGTPRKVFPRTNYVYGAPSCYQVGDTFQFGPFDDGDEIAFWLWNVVAPANYYSLIDPPGIGNPFTGYCAEGYQCKQAGWAYIPSADIVVFAFDDSRRGDWDYNDLLFFLWFQGGASFNKVPPYEDGLIKVCNADSGASFVSMAVVDCTQYALLESNSARPSCKTYMPIPAGWIWAPDTAENRAVIPALASKWAYTSATCFLLSLTATTGAGYHSDGSTCAGGEFTISSYMNGTKVCYNSGCTSRFVLRGSELGASCTSTDRCAGASAGSVLSIVPSNAAGTIVYPESASVLLKPNTGTVSVTTTLTTGTSSTSQLIDIVILADFSTVAPTTQQRDSVISSWTNEIVNQNGFKAEKLDVAIAFVQYKPSWNAPYYTLISDYTFYTKPAALSSGIFPSAASTCPSAGRQGMYSAASAVMRNKALNWRTGAMKAIWIHSSCDLDVSEVVTQAAIDTGVVPVFSFAGEIGGGTATPPSYSPSSSLAQRTLWKTYKSSSNWASPFSYTASTTTYPRGAGIFKSLPTTLSLVPITSMGDPAFFADIPTNPNTNAATAGYANTQFSLTWPSSGYPYNPTAKYTSYLRVMGRDIQTFSINFNRRPVLPDVSTTATGTTRLTVNLSPTDADGNTLQITVNSLPTKGKLFDLSDNQITTVPTKLPLGVYRLIYQANPYQDSTDSFDVSADDGCDSDPATVSVTLNLVNTPPVANDISIRMIEDSTPNNPANNGLIDFTNYISDDDVSVGKIPQTLSLILITNPSPSDKGSLVRNADLSTVINSGDTNMPKQVRFKLNQPYSGYGTVTFQYQVSDGTSQGNSLSNIATVTIQIDHKNHPPTLVLPVTKYFASTANFGKSNTISAFVTDIDFALDSQNVYIVASTLSTFKVQAGTGPQFTGQEAMPFKLYPSNLTSSSATYPLNDFVWIGGSTVTTESITLRAIDSAGGLSEVVQVVFETTENSPPTWTDRPSNASNGFASLSMVQDTTLSGLRFAATDQDETQWNELIFTVVSAPAHGTAKLIAQSGGANPLTLTAGLQISANSHPNYVVAHANTSVSPNPLGHSIFYLDYTPTRGYSSDDTFTFSVEDSTGNTAELAVTHIKILRLDTPPEASDIVINALEDTPTDTQISPRSTNLDGPGGIGRPVFVTLEAANFSGSITLADSNTAWKIGDPTPASTDPFVNLIVRGPFGTYSAPGVPTGTFKYRVTEPQSGLTSPLYTATIYITHVNHAPSSQNRNDVIKRGETLKVTLVGLDLDGDSPITAKFFSIGAGSRGEFFFDEALTDKLDSDTLSSKTLTDRTFYYRAMDAFSTNNVPLATYTFFVTDPYNLNSAYYTGSIVVLPAGYVPTAGVLDTYTYQETPTPMVLALGSETETGGVPIAAVSGPPEFGTFSVCDDSNVCHIPGIGDYPITLPSVSGRVVFVPRVNDWGMNFTSFPFTLTDQGSGAVGTYTMRIHVIHVNKPPVIEAVNFPTTAETNAPILINESSSHTFDWLVHDVDSLPNSLATSLRVTFYTSLGFSMYTCTATPGDWNSPNCAFDVSDLPFAVRADFLKNARKSISTYETITGDCADAETLKQRYGDRSTDCEAHFKMAFAPTPTASYTPYVTISFTAVDDYEAESNTISSLIAVKALNTPPTIWTPPTVLSAAGVTNPFIRDTDQNSAEFNRPVEVGDVDSNGNKEQLTINVTSGSGNLIYPESVPCEQVANTSSWVCMDRINGYNQWLGDLRFEVTNGDRATLLFEIDDLGFSSDYKPSPPLVASSSTTIILTSPIAPPKGNSQTLAIAVGVAAAAGLLLLGALGFFLRKAVSPPTDDYFAAATTPLAAAPQSPLYQAQNVTHENQLYKGM